MKEVTIDRIKKGGFLVYVPDYSRMKALRQLLESIGFRCTFDVSWVYKVIYLGDNKRLMHDNKDDLCDDYKQYKKLPIDFLIYVLKGEHYLTVEEKTEVLRHYRKMREWVKGQPPRDLFNRYKLKEECGEGILDDDCCLCDKHTCHICTNCPLFESGQCCTDANSIWKSLSNSATNADASKAMKKFIKYVEMLPTQVAEKKTRIDLSKYKLINKGDSLNLVYDDIEWDVFKLRNDGTVYAYRSIDKNTGLNLDSGGRIIID